MGKKLVIQFLLFSLLVLSVFAGAGIWLDAHIERNLEREALFRHSLVAGRIVNNIELYLDRVRSGVEHAFTIPTDDGPDIKRVLEFRLSMLSEVFPEIFSIAYMDPSGLIFFTNKNGIFQNEGVSIDEIIESGIFRENLNDSAKQKKDVSVSPSIFMRFSPEVERIVPTSALLFSKSMHRGEQYVGTLFVPYLLDFLIESYLSTPGLGAPFTTYLVNEEGSLIYRSDMPTSFDRLNTPFPFISKIEGEYYLRFPLKMDLNDIPITAEGYSCAFMADLMSMGDKSIHKGFFLPLRVGKETLTVVVAAKSSQIIEAKSDFILPLSVGALILVWLIIGAATATYQRLRLSEERLIESDTLHRALFEKANDAIFFFYLEGGELIAANQVASDNLGYSADELSRMRHIEIYKEGEAPKVKKCINELGEKLFLQYESLHEAKNGETYPVQVYARLLEHKGRQAVISTERDVTEQKALQARLLSREKEALNRKSFEVIGRLAGGVAHEFNNILGAILSCVPPGFKERQAKGKIISTGGINEGVVVALCKRGEMITSQLLDSARQVLPDPSPINPEKILWEHLSILRRKLPDSIGITIAIPGPLPQISTVPSMLHSALMNLSDNAIDAMEDGGEILYSLAEEELSGGVPGVSFIVVDKGGGIAEEELANIFEPFYTTKEPGKGTGLGLNITKAFVQSSGGEISVENSGGGASFKMTFPIWEGAAEKNPQIDSHVAFVLVLAKEGDYAGKICEECLKPGIMPLLVTDESALLDKINTDSEARVRYAIIDERLVKIPLRTLVEIIGSIRKDILIILLSEDEIYDKKFPEGVTISNLEKLSILFGGVFR
ncbi:MAG: hypothetical protein C0608_10555 [Deltaproteobacteria bacterium]|nr:MAG: hypothetical protein C0608_10555 [Deltaproteobacteria bacterium]